MYKAHQIHKYCMEHDCLKKIHTQIKSSTHKKKKEKEKKSLLFNTDMHSDMLKMTSNTIYAVLKV